MENEDWLNAVSKGFIGAAAAVLFTLVFHELIIPTSELAWALIAVSFGAFFSGFFAEITDEVICCDWSGEHDEVGAAGYLALGSPFLVLSTTADDTLAGAGYLMASLLFYLAAYRESEYQISDYI
ncbi:MAG: hypothetical protein ABEJ56_06835 [Candidatus Nanohaloarchaea archaeon]